VNNRNGKDRNGGNMDDLDYWRLCDDLSILQAALLIAGEDPSKNGYVESWEMHKRPQGYEAAKTAILNALKRGDIEGEITWHPECDQNGNTVGDNSTADIANSIVSVLSLRGFLKKRGISSGFFFPDDFDDRNYLDRNNSYYAPKLAAAVAAWENVTSNDQLLNGKTPKQAIEKWLREHASEYYLTGADGNPVAAAIEQISKVSNWKPEGGAAKTPTPPQVTGNPTTPEKNDANQTDSSSDSSEIPF